MQRGSFRVCASGRARLQFAQRHVSPAIVRDCEGTVQLERATAALCAEMYRILLSLAIQARTSGAGAQEESTVSNSKVSTLNF